MTNIPGDVRRWHASPCKALRNSGDTVSAHHSRCADMILQLWPDASTELILATVHHDTPELILGDPPYPAKRSYPALADGYAIAEAQVIYDYRIPQPESDLDARRIKLVDRLDAYLWMLRHAPDQEEIDGWPDALRDLYRMADELGVFQMVANMLCED